MPTLYDAHILYDTHGLYDDPTGLVPPPPPPPPNPPGTTYRLVLAQRSSSGLGAPVVVGSVTLNDVMNTVGVGPGASVPLAWKRNLNGPGSLEFALPIEDPVVTADVFAPGKREVHLYRDPGDGSGEVLWFAGRLWTADVADWSVRFTAAGWWEDLRHREIATDLYYADLEQHDLAWNYIAYTQGLLYGDIGITRYNTTPTGITRTVEVCAEQRSGVASLVEDLASADDGFDFDITPNKAFRIWSPSRGVTTAVVFDMSTTVSTLAYTLDATEAAGEISGIGEVNQCEPVNNLVVTDTDSLTAFGLLQSSINRPDDDEELLAAQIREELRNHKSARMQPQISYWPEVGGPQVHTFDVGDTVTVIASRGFATFSQGFRVLSVGAVVTPTNRELVTVQLDSILA